MKVLNLYPQVTEVYSYETYLVKYKQRICLYLEKGIALPEPVIRD